MTVYPLPFFRKGFRSFGKLIGPDSLIQILTAFYYAGSYAPT